MGGLNLVKLSDRKIRSMAVETAWICFLSRQKGQKISTKNRGILVMNHV
jgi:hypothetical protein